MASTSSSLYRCSLDGWWSSGQSGQSERLKLEDPFVAGLLILLCYDPLQTVLILKYVVPGYDKYIYYGGANVGMNAGVMLR